MVRLQSLDIELKFMHIDDNLFKKFEYVTGITKSIKRFQVGTMITMPDIHFDVEILVEIIKLI